MAERVYTTGEVGNLLGATPALLRDWVQRGWLAVDRLPDGSVHVTETALIQFLHRCGVNIEDVMARTVTRQARSAAPAATPAAETLDVTFSPAAPEVQAAPTADAAAPTPQRAPAAHEEPEAPAPSRADQAVANAARAAPVRAARQVLEAILQDAAQRRAAAVHLEWQADGLTLRLRIDGRLHEKPSFKARLPKPLGPTLVAECKALAALSPNETGRSQGGGGVRHLLGRDFDLRISTCPTVHGENVVAASLWCRPCRAKTGTGPSGRWPRPSPRPSAASSASASRPKTRCRAWCRPRRGRASRPGRRSSPPWIRTST
ncbi:MAG: hypothetical protein NTU94_06670 [Planctomycetota bacterium]|nr:hypothetical protein [Planctomycetota bacterium]